MTQRHDDKREPEVPGKYRINFQTVCSGCGREFASSGGHHAHSKRFPDCTPEMRFWGKVDKTSPNGCWLWTGSTNTDGYGHFRWSDGRTWNVHKLAYELHTGSKVPSGMSVMHSCDVRNCLNPSHLSLGTHRQNMLDSKAKRRNNFGERSRRNKLTEDQAREVLRNGKGGRRGNTRAYAKQFGVRLETIAAILAGRTWNHIREGK